MSQTKRQQRGRAEFRLFNAVNRLTTWLRFVREVRALRPMTLQERASDLRTARCYLECAERRAKTVRRLCR